MRSACSVTTCIYTCQNYPLSCHKYLHCFFAIKHFSTSQQTRNSCIDHSTGCCCCSSCYWRYLRLWWPSIWDRCRCARRYGTIGCERVWEWWMLRRSYLCENIAKRFLKRTYTYFMTIAQQQGWCTYRLLLEEEQVSPSGCDCLPVIVWFRYPVKHYWPWNLYASHAPSEGGSRLQFVSFWVARRSISGDILLTDFNS